MWRRSEARREEDERRLQRCQDSQQSGPGRSQVTAACSSAPRCRRAAATVATAAIAAAVSAGDCSEKPTRGHPEHDFKPPREKADRLQLHATAEALDAGHVGAR